MTDTQAITLQCQSCGLHHDPQRPLWACPCGGLLDVVMPCCFPWPTMRQRPPGLWRYREALPLAATTEAVTLGEGQTPLLATALQGRKVYLKLDSLLPTGSFKDRGATVLLSKIRELGISQIVEDSSGNAGAAIAAYAAAAGNLSATIYIPESTGPTKAAQIAAYGARLVRVPGDRAQTTVAVREVARHTYYASHVWNPYFLEGTKTIAFELWEQLGGQVPDWVLAPVGHGTLLLGLYKGFRHLQEAGISTKLPHIVGVQAANCAPLHRLHQTGAARLPEVAVTPTLAEGIAIAQPVRWRQILAAVEDTGAMFLAVGDEGIRQSWLQWARRGLLMEPTAATATAALDVLLSRDLIPAEASVVVPITGSGLKTLGMLGDWIDDGTMKR